MNYIFLPMILCFNDHTFHRCHELSFNYVCGSSFSDLNHATCVEGSPLGAWNVEHYNSLDRQPRLIDIYNVKWHPIKFCHVRLHLSESGGLK